MDRNVLFQRFAAQRPIITQMRKPPAKMSITRAACLSLLLACSAQATRIGDVTRLSNEHTNVVVGMGLVFGLKGSGDGGDFVPAMQSLSQALSKFNNKANLVDLKSAKNVAIVTLEATMPATGAHDGDRIDVRVHSFGAASSLKNGTLFVTPMSYFGKNREVLTGFAQGEIQIEDPSTPTNGIVTGGFVVERDFPIGQIENGTFRLIISDPWASWTMSSNIAKMINDSEDGQNWAWATGEKEVTVRIPRSEQDHPESFISRVQRLPVPDVNVEARVLINERTGTMIITGDVEISPVVISHKGLTISTVLPTPVPSARAPMIKTTDVVAIDTGSSGGAKLQSLINALDQLKVPVQDRIDIIKLLYKTGKLQAKLITE